MTTELLYEKKVKIEHFEGDLEHKEHKMTFSAVIGLFYQKLFRHSIQEVTFIISTLSTCRQICDKKTILEFLYSPAFYILVLYVSLFSFIFLKGMQYQNVLGVFFIALVLNNFFNFIKTGLSNLLRANGSKSFLDTINGGISYIKLILKLNTAEDKDVSEETIESKTFKSTLNNLKKNSISLFKSEEETKIVENVNTTIKNLPDDKDLKNLMLEELLECMKYRSMVELRENGLVFLICMIISYILKTIWGVLSIWVYLCTFLFVIRAFYECSFKHLKNPILRILAILASFVIFYYSLQACVYLFNLILYSFTAVFMLTIFLFIIFKKEHRFVKFWEYTMNYDFNNKSVEYMHPFALNIISLVTIVSIYFNYAFSTSTKEFKDFKEKWFNF